MTYPMKLDGDIVMAEAYVEGVYEDANGTYLLVTVHKQSATPIRRKLRRIRNLKNVVRL